MGTSICFSLVVLATASALLRQPTHEPKHEFPKPPSPHRPDIHFHFLLDRSGSMNGLRTDVVGGFNAYIAEQQRDATERPSPGEVGRTQGNTTMGGGTLFSLVQFDSGDPHHVVIDAVPMDEVLPLDHSDYQPRGSTPLYDAIGLLVARAANSTTAPGVSTRASSGSGGSGSGGKHRNVELPVVIIFTDGAENTSREWDRSSIAKLIREKESEGWTFVFLGANQDAFAEGGRIGLSRGSTQNYVPDQEGVRSAFAAMSSASKQHRTKTFEVYRAAEEAVESGDLADDGEAAQDFVHESLASSRGQFFDGNNGAQADFERRTGRGGGGVDL